MALPIHMSLEGETQGKIEGSCTISDRGTILVDSLDHTIDIPRDPQTGLPSGKRIHGPITITKVLDKASPKINQALCSGEHLKEVKFEFYRINKAGKEEKYYTIKLEDAIVVADRPWIPNTLLKENGELQHMEDVSFTYSKIIWTWEPDGIETEDKWDAPKS